MPKVDVYNFQGEKVREFVVNEGIFAVKPKVSVIHQVVVAQLANHRNSIAHTKDRSEVRGGGRKPWRQKGTGRARHGSIRSPLWRGGGITFGPTSERNYSQKVNKKMKQKALFMCLTDKILHEKMFLLDTLSMEKPKTKTMSVLFEKLPNQKKKTLIAFVGSNQPLIASVKNLQYITAIGVNSLNVVDVLAHDYLVTTEEGIEKIKVIYNKFSVKETT